MKHCRHCDAQIPDEYRRCVHCNRVLSSPTARRPASAPDLSRLHHLADDHPSTIAGLLDRLREAGVAFTLVTDGRIRHVNLQHGSAGHLAKASVFVDPDDRARAVAIHRSFLETLIPHLSEMDTRARPPGACPACNAKVRAEAETCASCGLAFPEESN